MPSIVAIALVWPALQAVSDRRGGVTLRGIRAGSHRVADVSVVHHNASQRQPRNVVPRTDYNYQIASDFFTMDAENMDEVPNVPTDDLSGHSCHPKCWWECGLPGCNTACSPSCKPPQCVTTCSQKTDMAGCMRLCEDPQCAVVCPSTCSKGTCPECKTMCNKPKCKLSGCGRICETTCGDPVCAWNCKVGPVCPQPECKMHCEKPSCTSFKGKQQTLHDVYHGLGDPTAEQSAVYGVHEMAGTYMAKVPKGMLDGLAAGQVGIPQPAVGPTPMEGPKPMKGAKEAKPEDMQKAGATGPKKPCKETEAEILPGVKFVGEFMKQ